MSLVLSLVVAMLSLAGPPPSKPKAVVPRFEKIRSATEFIRRLSAIHAPSSPAIKLAQIISAPRRGKASFAIVEAKWGTYAFAWSMEARFLAIWQPNGRMSCEADGGPCPTDEELGPLPKGLYYDWNQCMGTPAGIGLKGRYFADPPTEDGFSLIRTYPGGDGAEPHEDVLSFSAE